MKRSFVGVVGLVILLGGLVYWRCATGGGGRGSTTGAGTTGAGSTAGAAGTSPTAARARVDPKKLARGSLAGAITDENKAPIPKARVCADGSSNDLPDEMLRDPICITADDQGRYHVQNLLPARYTVSAFARSFRPDVHHPGGDRHKTTL